MKNKKIGLWFAFAFIISGFIFISIGLAFGGTRTIYIDKNGFHLFQNENYNKDSTEILEDFKKIDISSEIGNIELLPSSSDTTMIEYCYPDNKAIQFLIEVQTDTLKIELKNKRGFFINNFIGFNTLNNKTYVKLYLPKTKEEIKQLFIDNNIGNTTLKKININELNMNSDIGNIIVEDSNIKNGTISSNLGNISLTRTIYSGLIKSDLGTTKCNECNMQNTTFRQSAGNITYHGTLDGIIRIKNDLGNITLNLLDSEEKFNYKLKNDLGNIKLNNKNMKSSEIDNNSSHLIDVKNSTGNIKIQTK